VLLVVRNICKGKTNGVGTSSPTSIRKPHALLNYWRRLNPLVPLRSGDVHAAFSEHCPAVWFSLLRCSMFTCAASVLFFARTFHGQKDLHQHIAPTFLKYLRSRSPTKTCCLSDWKLFEGNALPKRGSHLFGSLPLPVSSIHRLSLFALLLTVIKSLIAFWSGLSAQNNQVNQQSASATFFSLVLPLARLLQATRSYQKKHDSASEALTEATGAVSRLAASMNGEEEGLEVGAQDSETKKEQVKAYKSAYARFLRHFAGQKKSTLSPEMIFWAAVLVIAPYG
jgi:hypothetical protein